jgi:spore maturation protein CgeB
MNGSLNIAFFGSSLLSSYWNGAATYYRGIIRALHHLGHRITFYEPDAYGRQQNRDIEPPEWANVVVYDSEGTDGVYGALETTRGADWVIKASGVGVHDELLEREVVTLKRSNTSVAFWDVDAPATLDRIEKNLTDPFRELIPKYDMIFTYGGGGPVERGYLRNKARECVPIYNALDPTTHSPVRRDERYSADLSFLGNRLPDREERVTEFFFRAAEMAPHQQFLIGGSGWQDRRMSANVTYVGHVPTADHNAFNCSARTVLNISRESMARYGYSPATRVFEAAGAGACLITDHWEGIEQFLEPDCEILVARNGDEVVEFTASVDERRSREIGAAALTRVLRDHTYAQRAAHVDGILSGRSLLAGR